MSARRHKPEDPAFDAVVIVGSQGALQACFSILEILPERFPVPIIVEIHRSRDSGVVERLLAARTPMPVRTAVEGTELERGVVYIAPAERQLLVTEKGVLATEGRATDEAHRFGDPLLTSAARAFGPGLIAVVLTGRLSGAAKGVVAVKRAGGRVLVQDPTTAVAPGMPAAALATGCADVSLPLDSIPVALAVFCSVAGAADLFSSSSQAAAPLA